jgi:hypothetical protein
MQNISRSPERRVAGLAFCLGSGRCLLHSAINGSKGFAEAEETRGNDDKGDTGAEDGVRSTEVIRRNCHRQDPQRCQSK